jgi:hypothetical protein
LAFPWGTSPYRQDSVKPWVVVPSSVDSPSVPAVDIVVVHIVADMAAVGTVVDHMAVVDTAIVEDIELVADHRIVGYIVMAAKYTVMVVQYSLVVHTEIVFDRVAVAVVLVDIVPTA